jgi:ZIP family zinc transporter
MRHPVEGVTKMNALTLAALGTGFTFLMTAAGAAVVFLFKNEIKPSFQRVFLGFAAGVMIAASVWSLLIPSIEMAGEQGVPGWLPAAGGFALGALFLMVLDALMPHLHPGSSEAEGVHTSFKRTTLLVLAVTLHNIPEGMAVGLACALAAGGGFYVFAKQKQKKQAEKEALDPDAGYTEDKGDFEIPTEDEPEDTGEEDTEPI